MENNYYDEILHEIEETLQKADFDKAHRLILNELEMPYIPIEIEKQLNTLLLEVRSHRTGKSGAMNLDEIEQGLKGDFKEQLKAIEALNHCNIRDFTEEIQAYLNTHPHPNFQALIVDTLIDQQLMQEFTMDHYGVEITFIPRYVEKAEDTDGFCTAAALLKQWFENEDPTFLQLCMQVLIQETFLMLPMAYEQDEGQMLALTIVNWVSQSMDEGNTFEKLKNHLKIKDCVMLELKSNNN